MGFFTSPARACVFIVMCCCSCNTFLQPAAAFSFGSKVHHSNGAGGGDHGSSPTSFGIALDKQQDDDNGDQLRGGSTATPLSAPNRVAVTANEDVELPPALTKLLMLISNGYFWNDSLQSLRRRFTVRSFKRSIGLSKVEDGEELDLAEDQLEPFQDDDELVTIVGLNKDWSIPIPNHVNPTVRASIYRTSTLSETHENMASVSLVLGPFVNDLPFQTKSALSTSLTGGAARRSSTRDDDNDGEEVDQSRLLPFATTQIKWMQVIPLGSMVASIGHAAALATTNLPRYKANGFGYEARVKDCKERALFDTVGSPYWEYNSIAPCSAFLKGTLQLHAPFVKDSRVVLFGDYCFSSAVRRGSPAESSSCNNLIQKSSIGAAIRRPPFKLEASYSKDHKAGISFGLIGRK